LQVRDVMGAVVTRDGVRQQLVGKVLVGGEGDSGHYWLRRRREAHPSRWVAQSEKGGREPAVFALLFGRNPAERRRRGGATALFPDIGEDGDGNCKQQSASANPGQVAI